jgi:hypothetical protein
MTMSKSIAKKSLEMTSLFEAEVLVQLLLRNWEHPSAADPDYANNVLENAAEALREAIRGATLIEGVPASQMNFIAAVWYVEDCAVSHEGLGAEEMTARRNWLLAVRRALPSCFCDQTNLQEP